MIIDVIIPSAGSGTRMKMKENKIFLPTKSGKSVLYYTLKAFCSLDFINNVYIPCRQEDEAKIIEISKDFPSKNIVTVMGGKTRTDSVKNALQLSESDYVMIHDAARPYVSKRLITRVKDGMIENGAVIPVIPPADTVKDIEDGEVTFTLPRERLGLVQTPQGFRTEKLKEAYAKLKSTSGITDDASVYEKIAKVYVVDGEKGNVKITTQEDIIRENRVGVGFDAHRFEKGRDLYLGGVKIESEYGLLGHSDADVVLHAVMDALLSSVHLRDIGVQFPCTPEYKDISSVTLLERVLDMLSARGAEVSNVSVVIVAEKPKLSSHIDKISANIARLIGVPLDAVSLTATTTEKLGFTGREEGIAAEAVCIVKI